MNYLRWAAILFAFLLPVSVGRAQPSITAESGLFDLLSQTVTQEVSELADSLPELQKDQQSQRVLLDWLFKRPAEKGSMVGQVYCGFFCMAGLTGTGKDDAAAVAWFRKAADQGDALSQLLVAIASAEGRGVGMNDREAVRWFRKLAKNNMDSGLLNMESSKIGRAHV